MLLYHTDFESPYDWYAGIAQAAERILGKDEVGSSSLPISSINKRHSFWGASCFLQLQEIIGRLEQDVPRNKSCLSVLNFVT